LDLLTELALAILSLELVPLPLLLPLDLKVVAALRKAAAILEEDLLFKPLATV